jgi:hypothetical protein
MMKYLVHKNTKKHIQYTPAAASCGGEFWNIVEADADGWIPFGGGECPMPGDEKCEVRISIGEAFGAMKSKSWVWTNKASSDKCIVAYRPICAEQVFIPQALGVSAENLSDLQNKYFKEWLEVRDNAVINSGESIFDRLLQATEAADSIPEILGEINALLPSGYRVVRAPQ